VGCHPQAGGGEEQLMVDEVMHFHPREPRLLLIDDLREISIFEHKLLDLDSKLSL
jgi:hypothetical protein